MYDAKCLENVSIHGPLPLRRLGHRFGWRDRARPQLRHAWTQRHHLPQNRSRWRPKTDLNGFAGVDVGTRVLACFFLVIICHQVTHFIVTWRQTTASLSGTSCDTGSSSGATGSPRQGRNNTLRSFMSTACQIHVSGSLETTPIPSVAKHIFITVAYIDNVLSPTQALLFQKPHF